MIYSGSVKYELCVVIIFENGRFQILMDHKAISVREPLVKLKCHPFDISIIQAYASTSSVTEDGIEAF